MSDRKLIVAAAEKIMAWKVVPFSWEDRSEDVYPRLIENINGDWILCAAEKGDWNEWNPLASDADAFMLVDAIHQKGALWFRLTSRWEGGTWAAGWTAIGCSCWNGRMDYEVVHSDRRRAIVLACLRAVGVEA